MRTGPRFTHFSLLNGENESAMGGDPNAGEVPYIPRGLGIATGTARCPVGETSRGLRMGAPPAGCTGSGSDRIGSGDIGA